MLLGGCSDTGQAGDPGDQPSSGTVRYEDGGQTKVLGAASDKEIIPVTLTDEYQKAAYFADQVYEANRENTLVSPLSLDVALGLAYEGASGTTREELAKYLGNENYGDWVDQYMTFAKDLKANGASNGGYSFAYELANSLWVKKDSKLKKEYQSRVENLYRATAQNVDFVTDANKTADKINSWCDEKTHGMIKKMVSPEMFSDRLEAILMNSVYFESPWVDEWSLVQHDFMNLKGEKETREMLRDCLGTYFENEYATAFAKRYYNGFEFIGILPKQEGEFSLSDLDIKSLLESRMHQYDVYAIAPKMEYETTAGNVVDILKAQGIHQAFDRDNGQFDGMVEGKELYISDILQKCKIEMDEKGTRAAAVTAIFEAACDSVEDPVIRETKEVYLDRPFAYLIYDSRNGKIVFAGKVVE